MKPSKTLKALSKKIKKIRKTTIGTQEKMADILGISTQAYGKIERGETDVNFSRLEQIADAMEIGLPQLLGFDEKNVFHFTNEHSTNNTQSNNQKIDNLHVNSQSTEQTEYQYELEKAHLMIEQRDKEIDYLKQENAMLKQQISDFRDIINMLKKSTGIEYKQG